MSGFVDRLARLFAQMGGLVLMALILLTCLSITGRLLNSVLHSDWLQSVSPDLAATLLATGVGPINGDYELVEAGIAFTIFAFLPLCQLHSAHASVDIFTSRLPHRLNLLLLSVIEIIFVAVLVLIAVQLFRGTVSKYHSGQTTLLLQFPVWWSYALCVVAACIASSVGLYMAILRVASFFTGKNLVPDFSAEDADSSAQAGAAL